MPKHALLSASASHMPYSRLYLEQNIPDSKSLKAGQTVNTPMKRQLPLLSKITVMTLMRRNFSVSQQ